MKKGMRKARVLSLDRGIAPGPDLRAKKVMNKLTDLTNIGQTTAARLEKIGIKGTRDFLRRDPYLVYEKLLKEVDPTLCRCVLASIVGAKTGQPWHVITKMTAKEYQKRHPRHKWGPC